MNQKVFLSLFEYVLILMAPQGCSLYMFQIRVCVHSQLVYYDSKGWKVIEMNQILSFCLCE